MPHVSEKVHTGRHFLTNPGIEIECGFGLTSLQLTKAVADANNELGIMPLSLWRCIDLKSTGSVVGAYLASAIARETGAIVNPIEKGHPDVLPARAANASEVALRNYPVGLEIKGTCGNTPKGTLLKAGENRCNLLSGITWQAHHQEVRRLLGIIWDFDSLIRETPSPVITAGFYSATLSRDCWGTISGTTGRNTKVSGMRASGKEKMAAGAIFVLNRNCYAERYAQLLGPLSIA